MKYRREIDGLRAIAVTPVILFHAGFEVFSGGYVGVDVFFVISGYLITSILIAELQQGDFSISRFYERRARRILPALFFVMLACLPFSYLWMLPIQLKYFAQSLAAVVLFASNILFWREEGYFAAAAELKPLLHTWSLAVEEQYYLLFPIFLLLLWRLGRKCVFWSVVTLAVLSLLLAEWGWRNQPNANFFLAPTRAWELLAGSICAFLTVGKEQRSSNFLSAAGLMLIVFSIFLYDSTTPFPSFYAMVPVAGAALVILFAATGTLASQLLSLPGFVGIGLISYSAYLWHQPLFAFARIYNMAEPDKYFMAALSFAVAPLAWATWRYVEQPFRKPSNNFLARRSSIFALSGGIGAIFVVIGLAGHAGNGFEWRFNFDREFLSYFENEAPKHSFLHKYNILKFYKDECNFYINDEESYAGTKNEIPSSCYTKARGDLPSVFVWGDSHAQQLYYGLNVGLEGAWNILQVATSGCKPALPDLKVDKALCYKSNEMAIEAIRDVKPDAVIIGYFGVWQKEELVSLADFLVKIGAKRVLIAGPSPRWIPSLPWQIAVKEGPVDKRSFVGLDAGYVAYNKVLTSWSEDETANFTVLDIMSALCDIDGCLTFIGDKIREGITTWDYGHLMPIASLEVARKVVVPRLLDKLP